MAEPPRTMMDLIRRALASPASEERGFEAFYNRAWWLQPTPNTIATQLLWAAIPAYGRFLKLFSGAPKGSLPHQSYGLQGLGQMLFRGLLVRKLQGVT